MKKVADLQASPTEVLVTNKAVAHILENQHAEATPRLHVVQGELASVAGTSMGPTTTDHFVAAIAFCENVIFARTAALSDLDLQALETTVTG